MSERDVLQRRATTGAPEAADTGGAQGGDWRMQIARQRRAIERRDQSQGAQSEAGEVESPQEKAQAGLKSGGGEKLPHLDQIQKAFGDHDVSGVSSHVGGEAAKASKSLNAQAFAHGDKVAFARSPDLHTAAHEAAHIVQQRAGGGPAG